MKGCLHSVAFCIPAVLGGCGDSKPPATLSNHGSSHQSAVAKSCADDPRAANADRLTEGTLPTLSGHDVGVTGIFVRALPGNGGEVRRQLSGMLVISHAESAWRETVVRGSVVTIGSDRYCITAIEAGKTEPGAIWVRKL